MASAYKLKWLNGPFSGRELVLPDGELRIGAPDADVLLCLDPPGVAVLSTGEDGVRLGYQGTAWVDGAIASEGQCLPLGSVIDIAGVAFVLGREDSNIVHLSVPQRLVLHEERPPARSDYRIAAAAVIGFIALGLMVWQPGQDGEAFDPQVWWKTQSDKPTLAGLRLDQGARGEWVLSGNCAHSSAVSTLRDTLRGRGMHFRDESVCADTVRESVRKVLALNGYHNVEVTSVSTDSVDVFGAIRADGNWLRTAEQLRDIPGLRTWWVKNDQPQLFERLLTTLTEYDLLEGVSLAVSNQSLLISGELSSERAVALAGVIEAFNETEPRLKAQHLNIPSVAPGAQVLPALIVTVGGNGDSIYVELANGMRLQQGSVLPSGYRVYALSHKAIALIKDQELRSLPIEL